MGFTYTIRARFVDYPFNHSVHQREIRFSGLAGGLGKSPDLNPTEIYISDSLTTPAEEKGLEGLLQNFPAFEITSDGLVWLHSHDPVDCLKEKQNRWNCGPPDAVCTSKAISLVQSLVNYLSEGTTTFCTMNDCRVKLNIGTRYYYWWTLNVNESVNRQVKEDVVALRDIPLRGNENSWFLALVVCCLFGVVGVLGQLWLVAKVFYGLYMGIK